MKNKIIYSSIASILAASLIACSGSTSDEDATLSIGISDGPVDSATEVVVIFNGIEIKPEQGPAFTITLEQPRSIDLLALQNGSSTQLLDQEPLESGNYNWIRLLVDADQGELDSFITMNDGTSHSLYVPSGSETGLKINRRFTVAAGNATNFMIDFDLRKSIVEPGNQAIDYKLKPTLRIVDLTEVGSISGFIDGALVSDSSCNEGLAVYAYSGTNIIVDDEGSQSPPLTSAIPQYDAANDRYDYQLSFLSVGDYTVAVTCDAEFDLPENDEAETAWSAISSAETTVNLNDTTILNFESIIL